MASGPRLPGPLAREDCYPPREGVLGSDPLLAELERCLAVAAYLVVRHGDAYALTFERLECELEQMRQRLGNRERAQRVLARLITNVR